MGDKFDGQADENDAIAALSAVIVNRAPTDPAAWRAGEGENMLAKTNPVDWMLDLIIAVVAIQKACGIDKRDVRRVLGMVQGKMDEDSGRDILQRSVAAAQNEIFEKVKPAIEERREELAAEAGLPSPIETDGN
jgi:hypothetical protein